MLNFIKKNKFKMIILPAVLLAGIFIGPCTNKTVYADEDSPLKSIGGWAFIYRSGLAVDKETRVQYIVVKNGDGISVTPRLNSSGKPMTK
ncbi:hypothetical protein DKZ22_10715 [Limosilactobacillus reuteri]|uniref:DUF6440 domain-containing protein n=1 Tax=Limosilactobacillus reuteri TaxID=1598 RepID=A0A855XKH7_LIMRT|nr:DUF6440 family protein [Limosilactobacillus reuteri]PWT39579.1 hypothetical protein DKZ22_10715 [Limosilactobacillus reuteri]PWT68232.1 hypothetical protein DKZ26_10300 [Limosilactobacillus reuteri]